MSRFNRFSILVIMSLLFLTLSGCYYTNGYSSSLQYRNYHS